MSQLRRPRKRAEDHLEDFRRIMQIPFADFLTQWLEDKGKTRRDLYDFVREKGFTHRPTSMDKHFNSNPKVNRHPKREFVELFAEYLELDNVQRRYLLQLWELKKQYPACF